MTLPGVHPGPVVDPRPFHLANVLGHAVAAVLAFEGASARRQRDLLPQRLRAIACASLGRAEETRAAAAKALELARLVPDFPPQFLA